MRHRVSVSATPLANSLASMSKKPPTTGVPSARPVAAAASAVTVPPHSTLSRMRGIFSKQSAMPAASKMAGSKARVCRLLRQVELASVISVVNSPVSL